ncbi:MAG: hypothetical protein HY369_05055 [Candidatus Aenigmarchaeota archaeon]|nr:hypothetical protein [Candidatus Aenigmarchaeota archaeon]
MSPRSRLVCWILFCLFCFGFHWWAVVYGWLIHTATVDLDADQEPPPPSTE